MRLIRLVALLFAAGLLILAGIVWWAGLPPRRPKGLSSNAFYIERGVVPFKLSSTPGDWIDCWFDEREQLDHCKMTDETGKLEFEDVFLPYGGQSPIGQEKLQFDKQRTGRLWTGTYEKNMRYPVIYLIGGEILLPKSDLQKARQTVDQWGGKRNSP